MKKIIKKIALFIGKIIKFFDRLLITPIMKLFIKITDLFKGTGKSFERILVTRQSLLIISLLIACIAFYVVDHNSSILVDNQAEILNSQPIEVIYNQEAYVVEGLPETVDVILSGKKTHVYLAKQQPDQKITVDLRELSTGTHKVYLKYRQNVGSVNYIINPSSVTVVIYDKVSATREVTYDILHRNKLDSKLDIAAVNLSKTEITIKGSEKKINEVAYVKALVDVENIVNPQAGTVSINNVNLVAYDTNGEIVDVEILPKTVDASVKLVSSSKEVPIKIIPEGTMALGYAIDSLTASATTVTIYGSEDNLTGVSFVPIYVDVNNVSANKDYTVNVTKPAGVREVSIKTINVKLTVDSETQTEVVLDDIQTINLDSKLKAQAVSASDSKITVIVKGTKKAIEALNKDKVSATIDLQDYTKTGEYEVEVNVSGDDLRLNYTSKTKKIKIRIYEK